MINEDWENQNKETPSVNPDGSLNKFKPLLQNSISEKKVKELQEKEADPFLGEYGKKIADKKVYNLFKWLVILLGIAIIGFGFMAYNGNLKTQIDIPACPNVTIPSAPTCPICPSCPTNTCSPTLNCGESNLTCPIIKIYNSS